jgi:hypothetical protein
MIAGPAKAVEAEFGISRTTLFRWSRAYPDFPVRRIGGTVLYDFQALREWLETHSEGGFTSGSHQKGRR